ncbi:alpha/beta hydrolase [Chamaesiphon sp. VAR_48_metabat_403]|uniref:alpha/beta hydrolase n=1 Tax=Chamaesiphon sp. VAR_48_metabat_403 TaxID=2964700 RepID=UPI00286E2480|nr:alpha/beta hydrolase [Chamaesiphon sp. VAR_48_metabat_403]
MQLVATIGIWIWGLLVLLGFCLSLWIIIPAPIFSLLPLSVGTPEISPGLLIFNSIILILGWIGWRSNISQSPRLFILALCISGLAVVLSASPLIQFPAARKQAQRAIEASLGRDYLGEIAPEIVAKMRSQPLIIGDIWGEIFIPQVRIDRRIPFVNRDGVPLYLNIYRPLQIGKYPAIVSIYGGAWQRGSPDSDDTFNRYIAAQGYTVWAISYRHAPAYQFPAQIEDVKCALTFIQNHATENETDLDRVAFIGRSAGAQLAMLAAYEHSPFPVRALVNYYGPVNLTAGYDDVPTPDPIESRVTLQAFLGGTPTEFPDRYYQASPINTVKPGLPASLLIYGGKDHIIQSKYGKYLDRSLRAHGNRAVFIEIPWADHAFDAVFSGVSNQLALYYTERFLAWALLKH